MQHLKILSNAKRMKLGFDQTEINLNKLVEFENDMLRLRQEAKLSKTIDFLIAPFVVLRITFKVFR